MSLQGDLGSSFDCNPQDNRGREMKNNNENALTGPRVSSDPNANAIRTEDVGVTGNAITLPPLVSQNEQQDKLVAWVMDSPSEDPDLEEFELLECQELGEDDERCEAGESGEAQSDPPLDRQSGSCSSAPEEAKGDGRDEGGRGRASRQRGEDLVSTRVGQQTGQQPLSEGDVFLSCLSTMSGLGGSLSSTLDGVGGTLATDSQDVLSEAYRTASEDLTLASQSIPTTSVESRSLREVDREAAASGRSTAHSNSVDLNMNSSALTQEVTPEAQEDGEVQGPRRCPSLGGSSLLANGTSACQQNRTRKEQHGQWQKAFREAEGEQSWAEEHMPGSSSPSDLKCNKRVPARPFRPETGYDAIKIQSLRQRSQSPETPVYKTARKMNGLLSRDEEAAQRDGSQCSPSVGSGVTSGTGAVLRKQDSTEHERNTSPSSLERRAQSARRRCGSPTQVATSPSPRGMGSPKRKPPTSPAKVPGSRVSQQDTVQQGLASGLRAPSKVSVTSGIPKPILQHTPRTGEKDEPQSKSERSPPPKELPKPKTVRPKIITYVRKSPQVKPHVIEPPYEVSTLPSRLSTYTDPPAPKGPRAAVDPRASPVLSASNLLYDKYRHEMQKARFFSPSLVVSGIRPPSHTTPHKLTGKSDTFYGVLTNKFMPELGRVVGGLGGPAGEERSGTQLGPQEAGAVFRSPRALRPQLGLGAVARFPSTKNRMLSAGQRSALASSHPARDVSPVSHCYQDPAADQGKSAPVITPKSFQPKHGQSGLRPPGYSRLPPARLAAFGFVRSASVSSVSSNQSAESTHSDPCRPAHHVQMFLPPPNQMPLLSLMASSSRLAKGSINKPQPERLHTKKERSKAHEGPSSGSDDPPLHRVTTPLSEVPRAPSQSGPQPPSTPVPTRRSLLPPPRSSPVASRKEIQKDVEVARPAVSSPKRFAVVPPRPQSPVHMRQKPGPGPGVAGRSASSGGSPKTEARAERDAECLLVRRLRAQCEEQARQLAGLQAELRKATLGLEVFAVSTQHFCQKSDRAIEREKELSLELAKIRDEVAFNAARWERLLHEKEALEQSFQQELRELQAQQEAELGALEEGLRARHAAETDYLRARHLAEQEGLQMRQREQIEDMTVSHETAMEEMENDHNMALAVLQDEHAAILRELRTTHEQQKNALEENFERLRLSLQDQVDTLTFQNRTLRDRAKRFEEALRRSTDEQILDALAPYQHIEEDLKSLKEVLEMKNQQIHQQEKKISELEKMAQKNVLLEEQVQVLQQQNEDLKARIDRNLALSRQLSEENANLQEHVEKESNEKKRLSRNNEELLWRLQTGELSPRMSPSSSPVHRASPGPASPSRLQSYPR